MRPAKTAMLLLAAASLSVSACSMFSTSKPGYVVFFTERSVEIDSAAQSSIAAAAHEATSTGQGVAVIGWTDSAGSPSADVVLSQQRAKRVADALIADGVPSDRITRRGRGQTNEDPGVASRRVNIEVGS